MSRTRSPSTPTGTGRSSASTTSSTTWRSSTCRPSWAGHSTARKPASPMAYWSITSSPHASRTRSRTPSLRSSPPARTCRGVMARRPARASSARRTEDGGVGGEALGVPGHQGLDEVVEGSGGRQAEGRIGRSARVPELGRQVPAEGRADAGRPQRAVPGPSPDRPALDRVGQEGGPLRPGVRQQQGRPGAAAGDRDVHAVPPGRPGLGVPEVGLEIGPVHRPVGDDVVEGLEELGLGHRRQAVEGGSLEPGVVAGVERRAGDGVAPEPPQAEARPGPGGGGGPGPGARTPGRRGTGSRSFEPLDEQVGEPHLVGQLEALQADGDELPADARGLRTAPADDPDPVGVDRPGVVRARRSRRRRRRSGPGSSGAGGRRGRGPGPRRRRARTCPRCGRPRPASPRTSAGSRCR